MSGRDTDVFVIRPDAYVGVRASIDDASRLRDYLAKLYRTPARSGTRRLG